MKVALVGSVGSGHNELASSASSITATRNGIVPGNTIVVATCVEDAATISRVSDGFDIVLTPDVALDWVAGTERLALYSFSRHSGGNKTFTVTFSASQTFRGVVVLELTPSVFDGAASSGSGSSATPSSGNLSPSADGSYIVGFAMGATALTVAGGFSDLFNDSSVNTSDTSGFAQTSRASVAATWTMTSGIWAAIAAAYRPLPLGPCKPVPPQQRMTA